MDKYRYKTTHALGGYEHILEGGKVYDGIEIEGIFPGKDNRYLEVYDETGKKIATAYLFRFDKVV